MTRRLPILILVVIVAVIAAVPAFAAPTQVAPKLDQRSMVRALAKARLALLTARSAKAESRRAARTAQAAVNTATDAKNTATTTQATFESTRIQSASAAGSVVTESETFTQLPGGPSVTVTVLSSGLIEVWAQATMSEPGAVSLYEDGQQMPGQAEECGPEEVDGALFAGFLFGPGDVTVGTPASVGFCGTEGAPGSVLFQTTPGTHTYELRYEVCGCGPTEVTFSKRLLRVAPRL
ncbi:MAG: hypothetical protein WD827_06080 [Solirubrobacterales bacterium]